MQKLRKERGLTQEAVAERMGMTHSAIGKLERGERQLGLEHIKVLSRVFHCHPIELLQPLSSEEREALRLLRAADPAGRTRALQMLKLMLETATAPSTIPRRVA